MSIYTEILACANDIRSDLVTWRRHIHQTPELRMETPLTEAYICDTLAGFGITDIRSGIGGHGVAATIHGHNERVRLEAIERTVEFYIRLMKSC